MTPRVSVCVPAYQAGEHLQETLDSVWRQDFEDYELIVVDDGSTDLTGEILAAQTDLRLRAFRHERNCGQPATVSETIARARADLVKFLDADDLLRSDCLGKMVAALDVHPQASFVFSRRNVLAEEPDDPATLAWIADLGTLQTHFGELDEVTDGRELLRRYMAALMPGNWIAEPAGVMARRPDLLAVGGYNRRVRQNNDMDLWARLFTRGDVVFIDEPLYAYRLSFSGVTGGSVAWNRQWLDSLWMAEGLVEMAAFPEPEALRVTRRRILARSIRRVARALLDDPRTVPARMADLTSYGCYRLARFVRRAQPLLAPIMAEPVAGNASISFDSRRAR